MQQIYLDNNSTTVIDPVVAQAMSNCQLEGFVNPASQHQPGQAARRRIEEIRSEILDRLGAESTGMNSDRLIFTSGGTESNNLAVIGLAHEPDGSVPEVKRVLVSSIEHPSVAGAAQYLANRGFQVETIAADANGVVDLDDLESKLKQPVRLVSTMLVNNETGVIQPITEIAALCKLQGALFHTDAVQAIGKIDSRFSDLGADAMTLTAHKLHGPRGIGGLVLRSSIQPFPLFFGGFQQSGLRPGTEDICLATGFLEAITQHHTGAAEPKMRIQALRDRLQSEIIQQCSDVFIVGELAERVPHTLNVSFRKIDRQQFLMAADLAGLAISSGSACASGSSDPSPVLMAMGLDDDIVNGSIRISLSAQTAELEIDLAAERIIKISNDLRR